MSRQEPNSVRTIALDVFLQCTLGGFAEPKYRPKRADQVIPLYARGGSYKQIGARLGISDSNVGTVLSKARKVGLVGRRRSWTADDYTSMTRPRNTTEARSRTETSSGHSSSPS